MAIYLDEQTRPVLTRIIKKWREEHPNDFVADRIQKALDSDLSRLEFIRECKHEPGTYTGHRTSCIHCDSLYNPGMGESWSLDK